MKKLFVTSLLLLSFLGTGSFLFGQDGRVVQTRSLGRNFEASPPTVTFEVYWLSDPPGPRHRDTVWVFVDYALVDADGQVGAWAQATLTAPNVTGDGTLVPNSLNGRGFYIDGHGATTFSSTVTVGLAGITPGSRFNWCSYVSDYPPNATAGYGAYELHGSPPFQVKANGVWQEVSARIFSDGCIDSLTDATGCPGWVVAPVPEVASLTPSPAAICSGAPVTLTATATGAAWYSFDGVNWSSSSTTTVYPTASSDTYTVFVKGSSGCTAAFTGTPVSVSINPPPEITEFSASPDEICAGNSTVLTVTATGTGLEYSYNYSGMWTQDNTQSVTTTPTTLTVTNVYNVLVRTSDGCTATESASVTVYGIPRPTLDASSTLACAGTEVTFTASGGSSYCFTQSCSACNINPYLTGNDYSTGVQCDIRPTVCTSYTADPVYSITMPESGTVTVWVRVMNGTGCIDSIHLDVVSIPAFSAGAIRSGEQTLCYGGGDLQPAITSLVDAAGGQAPITYRWLYNGSPISWAYAASYTIPASYNTAVGAHTFTREAHDNRCQTAWVQSAGSWVLTVNANFTATVTPSSTITAPGAAVTLTATPADAAYQWSTGETTQAITVQAPAIAQPAVTHSVTVTVNGCSKAAAATVSNYPVTQCTECCWDGESNTWVDCYVTTNPYPFQTTGVSTVGWSGNTTFYSNASGPGSDKNGRANTAAIASTGTSAVQLCKDLGIGWYLPAYEELYAMSNGAALASSNNRQGAGILTVSQHWSSTEVYGNGGRHSSDATTSQGYAVVVNQAGSLSSDSKAVARYVRCAWRP
jgi:hypothetical protein